MLKSENFYTGTAELETSHSWSSQKREELSLTFPWKDELCQQGSSLSSPDSQMLHWSLVVEMVPPVLKVHIPWTDLVSSRPQSTTKSYMLTLQG